MRLHALATGAVAVTRIAEAAYVWPSQYDEIEDILSLQTGYKGRGFVDGEPELETSSLRNDP